LCPALAVTCDTRRCKSGRICSWLGISGTAGLISLSAGVAQLLRIVTIEREYGAGGSVVAAKLANRLGWDLLDQSLTADIARKAEVATPAVAR
jgi:hypothetical protein